MKLIKLSEDHYILVEAKPDTDYTKPHTIMYSFGKKNRRYRN